MAFKGTLKNLGARTEPRIRQTPALQSISLQAEAHIAPFRTERREQHQQHGATMPTTTTKAKEKSGCAALP